MTTILEKTDNGFIKTGLFRKPVSAQEIAALTNTRKNKSNVQEIEDTISTNNAFGLIRLKNRSTSIRMKPQQTVIYTENGTALKHVSPILQLTAPVSDIASGRLDLSGITFAWLQPAYVAQQQRKLQNLYHAHNMPYANFFQESVSALGKFPCVTSTRYTHNLPRQIKSNAHNNPVSNVSQRACWGSTIIPKSQQYLNTVMTVLSTFFHAKGNHDLGVIELMNPAYRLSANDGDSTIDDAWSDLSSEFSSLLMNDQSFSKDQVPSDFTENLRQFAFEQMAAANREIIKTNFNHHEKHRTDAERYLNKGMLDIDFDTENPLYQKLIADLEHAIAQKDLDKLEWTPLDLILRGLLIKNGEDLALTINDLDQLKESKNPFNDLREIMDFSNLDRMLEIYGSNRGEDVDYLETAVYQDRYKGSHYVTGDQHEPTVEPFSQLLTHPQVAKYAPVVLAQKYLAAKAEQETDPKKKAAYELVKKLSNLTETSAENNRSEVRVDINEGIHSQTIAGDSSFTITTANNRNQETIAHAIQDNISDLMTFFIKKTLQSSGDLRDLFLANRSSINNETRQHFQNGAEILKTITALTDDDYRKKVIADLDNDVIFNVDPEVKDELANMQGIFRYALHIIDKYKFTSREIYFEIPALTNISMVLSRATNHTYGNIINTHTDDNVADYESLQNLSEFITEDDYNNNQLITGKIKAIIKDEYPAMPDKTANEKVLNVIAVLICAFRMYTNIFDRYAFGQSDMLKDNYYFKNESNVDHTQSYESSSYTEFMRKFVKNNQHQKWNQNSYSANSEDLAFGFNTRSCDNGYIGCFNFHYNQHDRDYSLNLDELNRYGNMVKLNDQTSPNKWLSILVTAFATTGQLELLTQGSNIVNLAAFNNEPIAAKPTISDLISKVYGCRFQAAAKDYLRVIATVAHATGFNGAVSNAHGLAVKALGTITGLLKLNIIPVIFSADLNDVPAYIESITKNMQPPYCDDLMINDHDDYDREQFDNSLQDFIALNAINANWMANVYAKRSRTDDEYEQIGGVPKRSSEYNDEYCVQLAEGLMIPLAQIASHQPEDNLYESASVFWEALSSFLNPYPIVANYNNDGDV